MDRTKEIQQVQRFLEDGEEMVTKHKADRDDMDLAMQLAYVDADMRRREQQCQDDKYISDQCAMFDKTVHTKHFELTAKLRTDVVTLINTVSDGQRAAYMQKIEQERDLSNKVLKKARQENDVILQNERQIFNSTIEKFRAQLSAYENERVKFKTLIESLLLRDEVPKNVEVKDGFCIPQSCLLVLMDNECDLDVVMRFKVHLVDEPYPDLRKYYDSREYKMGQFTITKPATTVQFVVMLNTLKDYGYRRAAELYYLNPVPGSQPSTDLKKIDGQDEVNELVLAHAKERTKICHLYLVGPEDEDDMVATEYYDLVADIA